VANGNREYLGVGWSFPVRPVAGRLAWTRYEDDVEQAIGIILETTRQERVMKPAFGAGLRTHVFDPNGPVVQRMIEREVRTALQQQEPRIALEGVRAYADPDQANVLLIEIDYVVSRTNSSFNMVYPFYLSEGA
jgi:phage baseplate assembly protein W